MITLIYAHPYSNRSRANRVLIDQVKDLSGLEIRELYRLYPDFAIDAEAEQEALLRADTIIWQGPMYWYSVPALLKHWFEKVLLLGWAYGPGGRALVGKRCMWAFTTGAPDEAFSPNGFHLFPLESFVTPIQQTAQFCGMKWLEPFVLHGAHRISDAELLSQAKKYRARVESLLQPTQSAHPSAE